MKNKNAAGVFLAVMLLLTGCVNPPSTATLYISPASVTLATGQQQQFFVYANGETITTGVVWEVNKIAGGNTAIGTISSAGLYTAPSTVPSQTTVSVIATEQGTNVSLVATATITPPSSTTPTANIGVSPSTIPSGANATLTWSSSANTTSCTINGLSTFNGIAVSTSGSVTVSVTQTTPYQLNCNGPNGPATAEATLTVQVAAGVTVSISPTTGTLASGTSMQFSATVANDPSGEGVKWTSSLDAVPVATGLLGANYTAPTVTQTTGVEIIATSVADPSASAIATITVTPPGTSGGGSGGGCTSAPASANPPQADIQPQLVQILPGATQTFVATLSGDNVTNQVFTWSLKTTGNAADIGTITPTSPGSNTAVYEAADVGSLFVVQVVATSQEYTCISGYATVQVAPQQ